MGWCLSYGHTDLPRNARVLSAYFFGIKRQANKYRTTLMLEPLILQRKNKTSKTYTNYTKMRALTLDCVGETSSRLFETETSPEAAAEKTDDGAEVVSLVKPDVRLFILGCRLDSNLRVYLRFRELLGGVCEVPVWNKNILTSVPAHKHVPVSA